MVSRFKVKINPAIIKYVRENTGWSIEEIARKIKTTKESYEKIESGNKQPTFRQLELLANYFKCPVSTFFLSELPDSILPRNKNKNSKELCLAIRKARYYQSISNELMRDLGIEPKPKIRTLTLQDNPQEFARKERENIGISLKEQFKWENAYQAFNAWRTAIESRNILVFQFKFPIEESKGFSLMDKDPPVIVINITDNILGKIFTLFHEYAHIILKIPEIYPEEIITGNEIENWCNIFALEFLIPEKALKEDEDFLRFSRTKKLELEILENLSRKFKVSKQTILASLKTFEKSFLIENEFSNLIEQEKISCLQKTPAQKCIQEKGKKFILLLLEAKEKGIITTQDVIEYLSINLKHLNKVQELITKIL